MDEAARKNAERTFGYRSEEVMGRELADTIVPPALREAHRSGLARYLATEEAHVLDRRVEMTAMRADGSEFLAELAVTRVNLPGEISVRGYIRDITERRQAQEELIAAPTRHRGGRRRAPTRHARPARRRSTATRQRGH